MGGSALIARILRRLQQAESQEPDFHFQDDYRIAWITVLYASRAEPNPHVAATYAVLGLHPDKVWPSIEARRRALLGANYDKFFAEHPPKKPVQSVRFADVKRRKGES